MLFEKVKQALETIRPRLQNDGGDIELVDVSDDGKVRVRLQGACRGCAMSRITLKQGVEAELKHLVPEVTEVENVI